MRPMQDLLLTEDGIPSEEDHHSEEDQSLDEHWNEDSSTTDQSETFGTSVPGTGFIFHSSKRSIHPFHALSLAQTESPSFRAPKSFATAKSSLASYATAPSVPGRNSNNLTEPTQATRTPRTRYYDFSTNALRDTITQYILGCIKLSCHGDFVPGATSHCDRPSLLHYKVQETVSHHLYPLGQRSIAYPVTLLDSVIDSLTDYTITFLESEVMSSQTSATEVKRNVALRVYESASGAPDLRDLVPANRFAHSQIFTSEWLIYLNSRGIILDKSEALDWSGRGQHVEYLPDEESLIPLTEEKVLGHSASAIVQSVRCRRIRLARKIIRCNKRLPRETAVTEVEHLQRLQHRHIVRLVGTYTFRKNLAILIYPVAQCSLDEFMDCFPVSVSTKRHLFKFFGCLANALCFIHRHHVKHMDIKPVNLLVRQIEQDFRIYVADFGIARAYTSAEEAFTDSPTCFTRIYAAPEVVAQDTRGFPADVFSLGCVFTEMLATMASTYYACERVKLADIRAAQGDNSYHANVKAVLSWYQKIMEYKRYYWDGELSIHHTFHWSCPGLIANMLSVNFEQRPTAERLQVQIKDLQSVMILDKRLTPCTTCDDGPEPFEAAEESTTVSTAISGSQV